MLKNALTTRADKNYGWLDDSEWWAYWTILELGIGLRDSNASSSKRAKSCPTKLTLCQSQDENDRDSGYDVERDVLCQCFHPHHHYYVKGRAWASQSEKNATLARKEHTADFERVLLCNYRLISR